MTNVHIRQLEPSDAQEIVHCFDAVYRGSYANQLFLNAEQLKTKLDEGTLTSVGAVTDEGQILAHMAMTHNESGGTPELGNTVVDPRARGDGLAWQVGELLIRLCAESGHDGFLHYPTTAHDIMQRQSLKDGVETGLMLGYIPPETDGQIKPKHPELRQASTVVYRPVSQGKMQQCHAPEHLQPLLDDLSRDCQLERVWQKPGTVSGAHTDSSTQIYETRNLSRLTVKQVGEDFSAILTSFEVGDLPCLQVDIVMNDPGMGSAIEIAEKSDWKFCAWLPGFHVADVLRLQKVDVSKTEMQPALVGKTAIRILDEISR